MDKKETAEKIISILENQSTILDRVLAEQTKLRLAVSNKDWTVLQGCIQQIKELSDRFVGLETLRTELSEGVSLAAVPSASAAVTEVRTKLIKSKAENTALGDYVHITQDFLQNVLDNIVPQRRNTLYSRKGKIVKPQPECVVLNKLY